MSLSPMICEDCSYPPNWTSVSNPKNDGKIFYTIKCRDCGEQWDEPENFDVDENVEDIIDDGLGPFD